MLEKHNQPAKQHSEEVLFYSDKLSLLSREGFIILEKHNQPAKPHSEEVLFYSDELSLLSRQGFIMLEKHNQPAKPHSEEESKCYSTQMNCHYYQGRGSLC